jgi:hypothetical protein
MCRNKTREAARMTHPTIAVVLTQFLADQHQRLAPGTFGQYQAVVELLQHYLNGYAYEALNEADGQRYDELHDAPGDAHREFCEIFGPAYILPQMGEFLNYFLVRKVLASQTLLRAAGTVTKRLAAWLADRGYVDTATAKRATEQGADAARDLPKATALAEALEEFAQAHGWGEAVDQVEDHFQITRVEPGRIWLEGLMDGRERGPIALSEALSRQCRVGWTIAGEIGRIGRRWQLLDVWNVYPR